MNKNVLVLFVLLLSTISARAQNDVVKKNIDLLDTLSSFYKKDCIEIFKPEISKLKRKHDLRGLKNLNRINKLPVDTMSFSYIEQLEFYRGLVVFDLEKNKIINYHKKSGNLIISIQFYCNVQSGKISRKFFIATQTKFACDTGKTTLFNNIDFIYLRKVLQVLQVPLKISNTITTLESIE